MLRPPIEVLPGLWQLTLPLPFELDHVNTYLLRRGEGWTLIDTGLRTADSYNELVAQLQTIGLPISAITEILLTHTHPDHVGQTRRLLDETGARLVMSREERDQLVGLAHSEDRPQLLTGTMTAAGVPAGLIPRILRGFAQIRLNFDAIEPDAFLEDGAVLDTALGPFQLIETPGHSPGHMCLYSRDRQLMISGDHILQFITPNIGWLPEKDALGDFHRSLQRVFPLEIETILPGHGQIFRGHQPWIAETRAHHDERCEQIRMSVSESPRTAHQLVGDLWARPLAPFHHRFALFEVLAHLEYMQRRNVVTCEILDDGLQLWRSLDS
ncbi:MAG: MBL fold metallo-hydrolase [Acidobacteria bacterium]|nr:MBL fold metallo-hydrolase [Acidobacteriota bacterium]